MQLQSQHKGLDIKCKCGINKNTNTQKSCTSNNKTGKYKSRCPCLKAGQSCGEECKCLNCANPNAKWASISEQKFTRKRAISQNMILPTNKKFPLDRKEIMASGSGQS